MLFKGEESTAVKKKIGEVLLQESFTSPLQTHSSMSSDAYIDEVENLKSGQLINSEAIQLLANSVSQIISIIAEFQTNVKTCAGSPSQKKHGKITSGKD